VRPQLPPLKQTTQSIYGLEPMDDGFPARRDADGRRTVSPILGKYAIQDYLLQADQTADSRYVEAARTVAQAAVGRMDEFRDSLVFWYEGDTAPIRNRRRHYSGLTQSHYLLLLDRVGRRADSSALRDAAQRVLRSLSIPWSEGGVLYERDRGAVIAETPGTPNDVVLNGWLTALVNLWEYADEASSQEARALFERNILALESMLPLFDVPALRNSRYGSAGYAYFRLLLPGGRSDGARFAVSAGMEIPGEEGYRVTATAGTRWEPHVFAADLAATPVGAGAFGVAGRVLRLNLVLNYLSHPRPNVLRVKVDSATEGPVVLQLWRGSYDPRSTAATREPRWADVARGELSAGSTDLALPIPWDAASLVAYPTSFLKRVGERFYNVYHFLHIDQLRRLHAITGRPIFGEYAERWTGYVDSWPELDVYDGVQTEPSPHRGHPYA
jgi:hypothetical protein